jgi:Tol biopolymer transport system component
VLGTRLLAAALLAGAGFGLWVAGSAPGAATGASSVIAYADAPNPTGLSHVHVLDADARGGRMLARAGFDEAPTWAPGGKRLVVAHFRNGGSASQLAILTVETGRMQVITHRQALDEDPAWSPTGRLIAFSRSPLAGPDVEIWVIRPDGSGGRRLTHNRFGDFGAAWSPGGGLIGFTHMRNSSPLAADIWVMRPDGTHQHRLIQGAAGVAWAPNGERLAFGKITGRLAPGCGCPVTDLYAANARGQSRHLLVRNGGAPSWSPDGSRIAFRRFEGPRSHLWVVNADGSGLRRLTGGLRSQKHPAWHP